MKDICAPTFFTLESKTPNGYRTDTTEGVALLTGDRKKRP